MKYTLILALFFATIEAKHHHHHHNHHAEELVVAEEESVAVQEVEEESQLTILATKIDDKVKEIEQKGHEQMQKLRAKYRGISLWECILYAELIVFSIAAMVAYLFYIPPGQNKIQKKVDDRIVNLPVDFENMRNPRKELKRQMKRVVKEQKTNQE